MEELLIRIVAKLVFRNLTYDSIAPVLWNVLVPGFVLLLLIGPVGNRLESAESEAEIAVANKCSLEGREPTATETRELARLHRSRVILAWCLLGGLVAVVVRFLFFVP